MIGAMRNCKSDPLSFARGMSQGVLRTSPIGLQTGFFPLEGDSLLPLGFLARTGKWFNKKVPVSRMFPAPAIETLATPPPIPIWTFQLPVPSIQPSVSVRPFFCAGVSQIFHILAKRDQKETPRESCFRPR
jgi:hypothetical protein